MNNEEFIPKSEYERGYWDALGHIAVELATCNEEVFKAMDLILFHLEEEFKIKCGPNLCA